MSNRHLVGRLSGIARQMEITARAGLGTRCRFVLSPDGTFRVKDGMGAASRLELAFPRMWHTVIPDHLKRAVVEQEFGGRDFLGRPTPCGRCGKQTPGAVAMVVEEGHPLCNECAGQVAPFLRTVCDAGLTLARNRVEDAEDQPETDRSEVTRALTKVQRSLWEIRRSITALSGALPEPSFAPGTDAPLNRSAQLYALLATLLQDHLEPALAALEDAVELSEMMADGR